MWNARRRTLLLLWMPVKALASFIPAPLHHFADDEATSGIRAFSHHEEHLLDDGSEMKLHWRLNVDPDTILSLDTEHAAGVRLLGCSQNKLVLRLPASHLGGVTAWRHIVASHRLHRCPHLQDHPLYHRVVSLESTRYHDKVFPEAAMEGGGADVVLSTEEFYSVADVVPDVEFSYESVPLESMHPERQQRQAQMAAERRKQMQVEKRRLLANEWTSNEENPFAGLKKFDWKKLKPNFTTSFSSDAPKEGEELFDLKPLTKANFGWNWNFITNETRNPQFRYKFPGGEGYMLLKKPVLAARAGITINFTSHVHERHPEKPPHVMLLAQLLGNAYINLDVALLDNVKKDVDDTDPLGRFHIPLLRNFTEETHFFKPLKFFLGTIPVQVVPGVNVGLDAFHLGRLKGSLQVGVNTLLRVNGTLKFDSRDGAMASFECNAMNVKILPPTWLLFTQHFELGAALKPSLWLKGGVGPVKDMSVEAQFIPYFNVSIMQQGMEKYDAEEMSVERPLVIYPFRAIGLPLDSSWAVRVTANDEIRTTSSEFSTGNGVVVFNDNLKDFVFGTTPQSYLTVDPIQVELLRDGAPVGKPVKVLCQSVHGVECHLSSPQIAFDVDGKEAILEITAAWADNALEYLLRKVIDIGLIFPEITFSQQLSAEMEENPPQEVLLKIYRNGQEYAVAMQKTKEVNNMTVMSSDGITQEVGMTYLESWDTDKKSFKKLSDPDEIVKLVQMQAELLLNYADGTSTSLAATVPSIPWTQVLVDGHTPRAHFEGTVPVDVLLKNNMSEIVAGGKLGIAVRTYAGASYWIRPAHHEDLEQGTTQMLHWTVPVSPGTKVTFTFNTWKLNADGTYHKTRMSSKLPDQVCEQNLNTTRKFKMYGDPCIFTQPLKVSDGLVGKTVAFEVVWTLDGTTYRCMSSPVTFVSAISRLYNLQPLEAETAVGSPDAAVNEPRMISQLPDGKQEVVLDMIAVPIKKRQHRPAGRRLGAVPRSLKGSISLNHSDIDFHAAMSELQPHCTRKPLEYKIGAGIYFRAAMHNLKFPGMEMQLPDWDSKMIPIETTGFGKKLSQLMPKSICSGGMCDGTLPGCPPQKTDPILIPKVEFELNRAFQWRAGTLASMKEAIAWALAAAPSLIEVVADGFKVATVNITTTTPSLDMAMEEMTVPPRTPYQIPPSQSTAPSQEGECNWVPKPECVASFSYKEVEYTGCSTRDHGTGWCSEDSVYSGKWRECDKVCSQELDPKQIVLPVMQPLATTTSAPARVRPRGKKKAKPQDKQTEEQTEEQAEVKNEKNQEEKQQQQEQEEDKSADDGESGTPDQTEAEDDNIGWTCFHYSDHTWDTWCQAQPFQDGNRYKFFQDISISPCGQCHCCQKAAKKQNRRLEDVTKVNEEETAHESSRFFVSLPPGALPYKLDEHLLKALLERGSFRGFEDGRERELGKAQIIKFKIHDSSSPGTADAASIGRSNGPPDTGSRSQWVAGPAAAAAAAAIGMGVVALASVRWMYRKVNRGPSYTSIVEDESAESLAA